ncbi:hypothetical protein HMPREF9130_0425 [Peptoniphilus sp. oral taxon 375 str. F0436]|nr:hypothetical protein HMPREF9130_0425 [Peptoniphilus sp. oral taxon 375 str. F0436]
MRYKELEKEIQNLNTAYNKKFKITKDEKSIEIFDETRYYVSISNHEPYCMQTWKESFLSLDENLRHDLLSIVYNFAQTPVDSRNLYPKFYISSKLTSDYDMSFLFKFDGNIDSLAWGYQNGGNTEFTQKEIDYICDKFHTNLRDFKIEEVEE